MILSYREACTLPRGSDNTVEEKLLSRLRHKIYLQKSIQGILQTGNEVVTDGGKKRRGSGSQRGGSSQSQAVERRILPTSKPITNHSQPSSPPAAPCVPIPGASHTAELNLELAHQRTKARKKQHSSTQPGSRSVAENKSSRLLQSTATSVQRPACMRSGTEP